MENYEVLENIGKGNFGQIFKIKRKTDNKILVWKEIDYGSMNDKEKQQIVSEVNILRELKHPNIVKYYDRIIDKKNSKIFIVMEYCEAGDMGQLIKRIRKRKEYLAEDIIWKIFSQLVLALHECHTKKEGKILHRDIKLSNVFLDNENNVKLGDFGLSRVLSNESVFASSHVGTPYYMSPEQMEDAQYNEKSDIWSLGCFLYEITTLNPPFEATTHPILAKKIKAGQVNKIPSSYSEELSRVIMWMLTVDQNKRPSVENLVNLPQVFNLLKKVSMRLRERRIKDNMAKLKKLEETLKEKENFLEQKELEISNRESAIASREESLKRREEELVKREKKLEERERYPLKNYDKLDFKDSANNFLSNNYTSTLENNNSNHKYNTVTINTNYCDTIEKASSSNRRDSQSNINLKSTDQLLLGTPQNNYNSNSNVNKNSTQSRDTNYTINIEKSYKSSINDTLNTSKTSSKRKANENDYNKLLSSPEYKSPSSTNLPQAGNYSKYINFSTPKDSRENVLDFNSQPGSYNSTNPNIISATSNQLSTESNMRINPNQSGSNQPNFSNYTQNAALQKNLSYDNNFSPKKDKSVSSITGNIKCLNTNGSDFKFDPTIYTGKNNYNFNNNIATTKHTSTNSNNCFNVASSGNINLKVCKSQKNINKSVTSFSTRNVSSGKNENTPQNNLKTQQTNKARYSSIATLNGDKAASGHSQTQSKTNIGFGTGATKTNYNSYYKNYY